MKHISQVFRELGFPERLVPTMYRDEQSTPFREVHLIPRVDYEAGCMIARCGTDCSTLHSSGTVPTCVVCIDMSRSAGRYPS